MKESEEITKQRKAKEEAAEALAQEAAREFSFETAERTELKGNFIQQPDLVFYNIPAKGYDKEKDIRYAL